MEGTNPFEDFQIPQPELELITYDWTVEALTQHCAAKDAIAERFRTFGPEEERRIGAVAVTMNCEYDSMPPTIDTTICTQIIPDSFPVELLHEPSAIYLDAILALTVHHVRSLGAVATLAHKQRMLEHAIDISTTARQIAQLRSGMADGEELGLVQPSMIDSPELVVAPVDNSFYNMFFRSNLIIVDLRLDA